MYTGSNEAVNINALFSSQFEKYFNSRTKQKKYFPFKILRNISNFSTYCICSEAK